MVLINDNSTALAINDPMPVFKLPATDDSIVDSSAIKESIIIIIFTCNHCPYAQAYEDRIVNLANEFDGKGVQFILINSNDAINYPEDSFENMQEKATELRYTFPYCYDESQEVAKAYGALCTPHSFVFKDQSLQYKGQIDDNWQDPDAVEKHTLKDAIDALVEGGEPEVQEANAIGCSIKWK